MKIKESKEMTEIREIRERLSEKLKDMTLEEQVAFTKKEAEELEKEFGISLPRRNKIPVSSR